MHLNNKKVLVVGLGATGVATAGFLKTRGADVTVTDTAREQDLRPDVQTMRASNIRLELGEHRRESFETADLVVISPGVPHTIAPVAAARESGVPILGEIELASRFIHEPIIAITGTNGKTTTTSLVGEMLKESGLEVFVGGNIGAPLIGHVAEGKKVQAVVAEISSFQLDTIATFRPRVAVLLNIAEDHLDRYPDFDAYARSKARIFENQQPTDIAILNGSDPLIGELTETISSRKLFFFQTTDALHHTDTDGASITDEGISLQVKALLKMGTELPQAAMSGTDSVISINGSDISLLGRHNLENAAAAAMAALAGGGTLNGVKAALHAYRGLAHRLEHVATIGDVRYYNDSKATNVDAVNRALECFSEPVVLILGGRNKGGNFRALAQKIRRHVKHIIAIGEAGREINDTLGRLAPVTTVTTMEDAVRKGKDAANPGEVVLLSPACASFDMYTNYAARGDDFRHVVEKLKTHLQ
jgi:UDP-N-acetylmuramoylalanine--D-glutamate ligase